MKNLLTICFMVVLGVVCFSGRAFAEDEESKLAVEVRTDFFSDYVFRGLRLNKDPVFQPSVNVGYKQLTATIWGNLETTDIYDSKGEFTELDWILDWSDNSPIEGVCYSVGLVHFDYPNTEFEDQDTTEFYVGLNFDFFLNPSFKANFDLDEAEGVYLQFGLSHSVEQIVKLGNTPVGMEIAANLGWGDDSCNRYYSDIAGAHLNDLTLTLAFPIELKGNWSIIPSLNYATLIDRDIRKANAYGSNDNFFTGISVVKRF